MKINYSHSQTVVDELEWVSELEDVDHDICEAAKDARDEILRLSRIIAKLSESCNQKEN